MNTENEQVEGSTKKIDHMLDTLKEISRNNNLFSYSLVKYFNVFIGIIQGFLQVWFFTHFLNRMDLAFIFFIFGLINYFSLFDLGLGRPVYAKLRSMHVAGDVQRRNESIVQAFYLYIVMIGFATLVFIVISVLSSNAFKVSFSTYSVILLGFSLSVSIGIGFLRDIFEALDKYKKFEIIDLMRRSFLLIGIVSVALDPSIRILSSFYAVSLLALMIFLYIDIYVEMGSDIVISGFRAIKEGVRSYRLEMRDYFIFKVNEVFIYNWGYVVLPLVSAEGVLAYSIINRLFLGIAIPLRTLTDVLIHPLTRMYYEGKKVSMRKLFLIDLILTMILGGGGLFIIWQIRKWLSLHWLNGQVELSVYLLSIVTVMVVGNIIQHPSGKVLLSIGSVFLFMKKASIIISVLTLIPIALTILISSDYELMLLLTSCVYFLGALIYFSRVKTTWK